MFQIRNDLAQRAEVIKYMHDELDTKKYHAGKYLRATLNLEEIIRVGYKENHDRIINFYGLEFPDSQPDIQHWYKIPQELFNHIITKDFSTFQLKIGRRIYFECIEDDGFKKFFTAQLQNPILRCGPNFNLKLIDDKAQRLAQVETFSECFVVTNKKVGALCEDITSFEFIPF